MAMPSCVEPLERGCDSVLVGHVEQRLVHRPTRRAHLGRG